MTTPSVAGGARLLVVLLPLLLAACAGNAPKAAPASATGSTVGAAAPVPVPPVAADAAGTAVSPPAVSSQDDGAAPVAAAATQDDGAVTSAEDDYAALYGEPVAAPGDAATGSSPAYDPWEGYNRGVHRFNLGVDRFVAKPLATAYTNVVPATGRLGVNNFFDNLRSPLTFVNQLLQGHPVYAMQTLGRFVMNTTLGVGGLMDPASAAGIPRRTEDFGQTLGAWGWRNSRYFELPFFGPRTVRDTFGLAGDVPFSVLGQSIDNNKVRFGLQGLQLVDTRARLMSLDAMREQAPDEYALVRDAWLQRRNYQITQDLRRRSDDDEDALPDYLHDEGTVPVDAMPIPTWGN